MPTALTSPEEQAEIDDLGRAIEEAVNAEIGELAANPSRPMMPTASAPTNSRSAIALGVAAKAFEQHLARKKSTVRQRARNP